MKIINTKEQILLNRTEINSTVEYKNLKTPSRKELKEQIAKHMKTTIDLITIEKIRSEFGKNEIKILAHVYKDQETLKKFQIKKKKEQLKEEAK